MLSNDAVMTILLLLVTVTFDNMQTLLSQWFHVSLMSDHLSGLLRKQKFTSPVQKVIMSVGFDW